MDYNRTKILPHSQPFFSEADIESDIDNDYEESQSLISSRKRYSNEHGSTSSSAVTEYYSDLSTKVLEANSEMILNESGLPDSQPLFTEAKIDTASYIGHDKSKTRKIDTMPITEEFLPSISVSSMNQRNSKVSSSAITINYSDSNIKVLEANSKKFTNEQEAKRDSVSDSYSKNEDNVTHVTCIKYLTKN